MLQWSTLRTGLHSAFWLLQHDPTKQEYAPDGRRRTVGEGVVEIDIFEPLGRKTLSREIDFNIHFTSNGGHTFKMDFDPSKEFHVWALEWKEGELHWFLDGKEIHSYQGETPQEEMFILLGLYPGAVPGWVGPTDPNMPYPRDFEIDYIRVYARESTIAAAEDRNETDEISGLSGGRNNDAGFSGCLVSAWIRFMMGLGGSGTRFPILLVLLTGRLSMDDSNRNDDEHDDFVSQAEEAPPGLIAEFFDFLIHNKKWWLIPIVLVLAAVGLLVILNGTAVAPFLYSFW